MVLLVWNLNISFIHCVRNCSLVTVLWNKCSQQTWACESMGPMGRTRARGPPMGRTHAHGKRPRRLWLASPPQVPLWAAPLIPNPLWQLQIPFCVMGKMQIALISISAVWISVKWPASSTNSPGRKHTPFIHPIIVVNSRTIIFWNMLCIFRCWN